MIEKYKTPSIPLEDVKGLVEALLHIEQMSDPGSCEKAVIDMKSIATNALKSFKEKHSI